MATDFKQLADKNKKLGLFLEQKMLDASPLVIPKNPQLYHQYYQKLNNKRNYMANNYLDNVDDDTESTASGDSFFRIDENVEEMNMPTSSGRTSQEEEKVPEEDDELNMHNYPSRPQTGKFGKVTKFATNIEKDEENGFFLTETAVGSRIPIRQKTQQQQEKKKPVGTDILDDIQLQMSLPPLLVHQHYNDRARRHKKYSEPLVTIRHEDLLEELESENPHLAYKGKPLVNPSKELLSSDTQQLKNFVAPAHSLDDTLRNLDEQSKIHKVSLRYTKKALARAKQSGETGESRLDPSGYPRGEQADMLTNKLSDAVSSSTRNRQGYSGGSTESSAEAHDEMDFHAPNLAQDIERLKKAQLAVLEHVKLQEQLKLNN
jgi:hypothetical protein